MDEDDDDYLFDNLDEDELLHVVETAEQKHTQSQVAQTRRGASTAAATRPAGPFRPSTIIEAPKVSVHKQQPGGSSNGHTGSSGPANNLQPAAPRIRPPKRPTYRDEFPDVVLDDKVGGYRPKPGVPSEKTADPEKDALKQELERVSAEKEDKRALALFMPVRPIDGIHRCCLETVTHLILHVSSSVRLDS